jgi:hypothetical protein
MYFIISAVGKPTSELTIKTANHPANHVLVILCGTIIGD